MIKCRRRQWSAPATAVRARSDDRATLPDHPNFYFAFTPNEDPDAVGMPWAESPSQFAVPRSIDDISKSMGAGQAANSGRTSCSDECLARGDLALPGRGRRTQRIVPTAVRRRRIKPFSVLGRTPIQFRHAVFAVDFRVPQDTGLPYPQPCGAALSERTVCVSLPFRARAVPEHSKTHQALRALAVACATG